MITSPPNNTHLNGIHQSEWNNLTLSLLLESARLLAPEKSLSELIIAALPDNRLHHFVPVLIADVEAGRSDSEKTTPVEIPLTEPAFQTRHRLHTLIQKNAAVRYPSLVVEFIDFFYQEFGKEPAPLPGIVRRLAERFGLSHEESSVLAALHVISDDDIEGYFASKKDYIKLEIVANMCRIDAQTFISLTSRDSTLDRLGLLFDTRLPRDSFSDIRPAYPVQFCLRFNTLDDLFSGLFAEPHSARYALDSYSLSNLELETIRNVLACNRAVLITGDPGTGKTEFAHSIAQTLCRKLKVLPAESPMQRFRFGDGGPIGRLKMLRIADIMVDHQQEIILIDEADSILRSARGVFTLIESRSGALDKGKLNRVLEELRTGTIWITNDLEGIPQSVLRRFAHICQFPRPGRLFRERMLTEKSASAGITLEAASIRQISASYDLTPASIDLLINALQAEAISGDDQTDRLNTYLGVVSRGPLSHDFRKLPGPTAGFNPAFCNTDYDLNTLEELARARCEAGKGFRILLDGEPGGGKTEYALYLARMLEKDVCITRPSDLVAPYVGETEQKIAALFRRVESSSAVLILDEADALLGDRAGAERSFEIRWAAEFLQRIQSFEGILIACTNRSRSIDPALRRRFHRRVLFGPLKPEQIPAALELLLPEISFREHEILALQSGPPLMMSDIATAAELLSIDDGACGSAAVKEIQANAGSRTMKSPIGF